jgi:hypothetical protein
LAANAASETHHFINLLKSSPFDFWKEEPNPNHTNQATSCPDISIFRTYVWLAKDSVRKREREKGRERESIPQPRELGLIKYGAVKATNHPKRYPIAVAIPSV